MTAQARGWGPAPAPASRMATLRARLSGATFPQGAHQQLLELMAVLLEITERRGYRCVVGWCWGYAPRRISGSTAWSNHAWGLAPDINAPRNPQSSRLITDMPSWMPRLWEDHGFRWGGRYTTRPDAMHYEYMGTPAQVAGHLARARKLLATITPQEDEDVLKKPATGGAVWRMQRMINEYFHDDPDPVKDASASADLHPVKDGLRVDSVFGDKSAIAVNELRRAWNHQPINGEWDMDVSNRVQDHLHRRDLSALRSELLAEIRKIPAGSAGGLDAGQVRTLIDGARVEVTVRLP